jgi:hypothetical protein
MVVGQSHYSVGKKYCRRCECYFIIQRMFCECCGMQLRATPPPSCVGPGPEPPIECLHGGVVPADGPCPEFPIEPPVETPPEEVIPPEEPVEEEEEGEEEAGAEEGESEEESSEEESEEEQAEIGIG